MTVSASHEVHQHIGRAKRSADAGPVVITDRGWPACVLLRHEAYLRLVRAQPGIRNQLAIADLVVDLTEIVFDPAQVPHTMVRPAYLD